VLSSGESGESVDLARTKRLTDRRLLDTNADIKAAIEWSRQHLLRTIKSALSEVEIDGKLYSQSTRVGGNRTGYFALVFPEKLQLVTYSGAFFGVSGPAISSLGCEVFPDLE
jgi:hypothetical protein